ncbi:HNH endonuclease [Pseudenhygromyxa sp. WMMC2535]|uniref:HNH endonuclease signature motif containing protein n=1 Tax=Pseudenhygromyxa sp. WMMC2535 TaxID=2712867 RepID=UPI0015517B51|nr:HNH endonuclease signature motif containing protein [Pseudenhygromyxa sp. WMMC2535]NVB39711.1 HNH endonuclease [Pseudenhygromyxa sp. WMMC2535]
MDVKVFSDEGRGLDAHFEVAGASGADAVLRFRSAGGRPARNADYNEGLELLLERLGAAEASLLAVEVDSQVTASLPIQARVVALDDIRLPLDLSALRDYRALRICIGRGAARIGRAADAKPGGGNTQKQLALHLRFPASAPLSEPWLRAFVSGEPWTHEHREAAGRRRAGGALSAEEEPGGYQLSDADTRERLLVEMVQRRGQQRFRRALIDRDGAVCAISGCRVREALEAAHLSPYRGEKDNDLANGVLLRADLHKLFDRFLIGVHPQRRSVHLNPVLSDSEYASFEDQGLHIAEPQRLSEEALAAHWARFEAVASEGEGEGLGGAHRVEAAEPPT